MPRITRNAVLLCASTALVLTGASGNSDAQSVRDKVKEHVDKELEDPNSGREGQEREGRGQEREREGSGQERDRRRDRRGQASPNTDVQGEGTPVVLELMDDSELVNPTGPRLPIRLFPGISDLLRLDLKIDAAYRGWLPQQYSSASVDVANYLTYRVALKGKFFKYVTLHKASYEANGLSSPRNKKASVAALIGKHTPKAAKALAYIGFPIFKSWQPIIRYETQTFSTSATPKIPLCIVDFQSSADADLADCPKTTNSLRMNSSYETFVAAIRFSPDVRSTSVIATRKAKLPPVYVGMGLLSYRKPYQVTIDGNTLEEFLFDGHFRGAGLAFGTNLGGGARRFFASADIQVGLGEVALTQDFKLNEVTPDDWLLGYVQGNIHAGYRFVLYDGPPTVYFRPSASVGGASFHFINTSSDESGNQGSPTLNWDFLWSARTAIEIAF